DRALDWLLEPDQPSIRYRALTQLEGRPENDPDVLEARRGNPQRGWAAEILRERGADGTWGDIDTLYLPKYRGTNWRLLVLADLGLTKETPAVRVSAELWMERYAKPDGAFGIGG